MLTDGELLGLNIQGFIPGPAEDEESFSKRVCLCKKLFKDPPLFFAEKDCLPPFKLEDKIKSPDREWTKASLLNCFGFSASYFSAYFSDEKLKIFQGAATWLIDVDGVSIPILQLRKKLKKGAFFKIYELEDILAHELAHFARAGFDDPKFEEFFAYFTSSSVIRKLFGPIAVKSTEIALFLFFLIVTLASQYLGVFFNYKIFDILFLVFCYLSIKIVCLGIVRLGYRRWTFNKCYKKLFSIFGKKEKAMAVMFRLTDKEIKLFSKSNVEEIRNYAKEQKEKSLRWKVIDLAYFDAFL